MQEAVDFYSWGCKIAGVLHIPDTYTPGGRRPAVVTDRGGIGASTFVKPDNHLAKCRICNASAAAVALWVASKLERLAVT